jgi:DNA-directed RNA polymerase subunit omega
VIIAAGWRPDFKNKHMNSELVKLALEKVPNPYVLVNLVSRRVRQLNAGARSLSRPAPGVTEHLGPADIALTEIIEDKMGFDMPEIIPLTRPAGEKRKRPQGWGKPQAVTAKAA